MDEDGRKLGNVKMSAHSQFFFDQRLGRQMLGRGISLKTFSHLYAHFSNPDNRIGHVKAVRWYRVVVGYVYHMQVYLYAFT